LKKDEDYGKIYNSDYPIGIYYVSAEIIRRVEAYLKSSESGLVTKDRNNLRFYVAMHVVAGLANKPTLSAGELAKLDVSKLSDASIKASLDVVKREYGALGSTDQVAKGRSLLDAVKAKLGGVVEPMMVSNSL
jgi:hypothetical protein